MKCKVMTKHQAVDLGIRQAENIVACLLFDKFDWTMDEINAFGESIAELSDAINENTKTTWTYLRWSKEHNLSVLIKENTSFATPEMRERIDDKIRSKKTVYLLVFYALGHSKNYTVEQLQQLKSYIEDLQDSIDKKVFLTYDDVYKEQKERGFLGWK